MDKEQLEKDFYNLYVGNGSLLHSTAWMGVPCLKIPFDMWLYQEMMWELKPEYIVETGTFSGGSALFMAGVYDQLARYWPLDGKVITIDLWDGSKSALQNRPHPRVKFIQGSSTSPEIFTQVKQLTQNKRTMVVLDSDHSTEHVFNELNLYSEIVTVGQYLVVEDTCTAGPAGGLTKWLLTEQSNNYEIDTEKHSKFHLTCNPNGYLKRVK